MQIRCGNWKSHSFRRASDLTMPIHLLQFALTVTLGGKGMFSIRRKCLNHNSFIYLQLNYFKQNNRLSLPNCIEYIQLQCIYCFI